MELLQRKMNQRMNKISCCTNHQNSLLFKHYTFYYENVSQISHLKLNSKDEISPTLAILIGYKFKIVTIILTIILGLSYHFSIDYSQLPLIESELLFQIIASLLVIGFVAGFEHIIFDYFTKNTFQTFPTITFSSQNEPKIILEERTNN